MPWPWNGSSTLTQSLRQHIGHLSLGGIYYFSHGSLPGGPRSLSAPWNSEDRYRLVAAPAFGQSATTISLQFLKSSAYPKNIPSTLHRAYTV